MKIFLLFILFPIITYGQIQIGQDINGVSLEDHFGTSTSLSCDGTILAVGAFNNDGNGINSGQVQIFENQNNTWIQIGQNIDGEVIGDHFGSSISISCDGNILAIGASNSNNNSGLVQVYENVSGVWTQIGNDISGETSQRFFGRSVSLSSDGKIVAIGANLSNGDGPIAGQVSIYKNQGNSWVQVGNDINQTTAADVLGTTVSISANGSVVAIGTPYDNENGFTLGHVRIYRNQGNSWIQIGDDISNGQIGDQFGRDLCLSSNGSIVAISSMITNNDDEQIGHVSIYKQEEGSWIQTGDDIEGEIDEDQFGRGLSLSSDGSIVAIGARLSNDNGLASGQVRIYQNQENIWRQIGNDINGDMTGDQAGTSVSLSSNGSIVAIGSNFSNGGKGEVRVFDLNGLLLSINTTTIASRFKLFPNPAVTTVHIEFPEEEEIVLQKITMYNSVGQLVYTTTQQTNIDTSQFSKGMYFIKIRTDKGVSSKRLIIE
ncbi:T9SS type A sorting domain-containing protein [Dokdonia sp.]|uniref:T9SS type A sorting domain-containing protein n=1 Tax=Dokdonia sp. TaxID=2024995 RepID=UPI003264D0CA